MRTWSGASVCELLGVDTIDEEPQLAIAARRSNPDVDITPEQRAWVARVQRLGVDRVSTPYDRDRLAELATGLARRIEGPQDLRHLPDWLAACGVALVIELPLRNSKIDGMVSYSVSGTPVIGLSTRWDRMDIFVFTLLHEIAHLVLEHIGPGDLRIDEDVDAADSPDREKEANETAAGWIFTAPPVLPDLSPATLAQVAHDNSVHPSLLIGRLQKEGRLGWSDYRRTIPKVRPFVELG